MNVDQLQLRQDSTAPIIHITCTCNNNYKIKTKTNKKTPYKIQDMCYLLSELNAEYIPLKREISQ